MSNQSSRERMMAALSRQTAGHIPCCCMAYQALRLACRDDFDFFDRQLDLGLDVRVELPDLPIRFDPRVSVHTWKDQPVGASSPLLHKEYRTPSGTIGTVVRQTGDWPHDDQVPLFDDYIGPRANKFLVTKAEDLAGLRHLLLPPADADIRNFQEQANRYKCYAFDKMLLLAGGWRDYHDHDVSVVGSQFGGLVGVDALMWLCGATAPLEWAYDQPDFLEELLDIIAHWVRRRLEITLDIGVDLVVKRAWYEGTELWSPKLYRQFIKPILRQDIALVHEAGAKFGYINTSGTWPIFDDLLELGVDALIGVDPVQGVGTNLDVFAQRAAGQMCLWGGVSAPMTIEVACSPDAIWNAVENALSKCGPHGGFILSPVDNLMDTSQKARDNVIEFIRAWKHIESALVR